MGGYRPCTGVGECQPHGAGDVSTDKGSSLQGGTAVSKLYPLSLTTSHHTDLVLCLTCAIYSLDVEQDCTDDGNNIVDAGSSCEGWLSSLSMVGK